MSLAAIPTSLFLSRKEVKLGSFTTDLAAFHEDYKEPEVNGSIPSIEKESKFISQKNHKRQTNFSAALSSTISAKFLRQSAGSCSVDADSLKWYLLDNVVTWFERALESEAVKLWIQQRAARDQNIYMIVGIQTLVNPKIELDFTGTKQGKIDARLLLQLPENFRIVAPATEAGGDHEATEKLTISASGEQIFALRYRKVKFRWLKRLSSSSPRISGSFVWTCLDTSWRGSGDRDDDSMGSSNEEVSDDEGDDMIEVSAEMESSLPDEDWAEEITENGHYCINTSI